MFKQRTIWIALVAATGMAMGPAASAQQRTPAAKRPAQPTPAAAIQDVALKAGGTFTGHVLNREGKAVDGAAVTLRSRGEELGRQTTDPQGRFTFAGLKGGVYEVHTPVGVKLCRLWTADTAPPGAVDSLVVAGGSTAVRGQFGFLDPANTSILLLSIAGVTISAVALSEINDVNDKVDRALQSP